MADEGHQFERTMRAFEKSGERFKPTPLKKVQVDFTTIQRLLEKDLAKKMPIKLKTQLRKTQEIADIIIGEETTKRRTLAPLPRILSPISRSKSVAAIVHVDTMQEEDIPQNMFDGVDQSLIQRRLSIIQAKNKQISQRVNNELRKFKKNLAGDSLKTQIQRYVEKIGGVSRDIAAKKIKPMVDEQQRLKEHARKFVKLARYSILPYLQKRQEEEMPSLLEDAASLFHKGRRPGLTALKLPQMKDAIIPEETSSQTSEQTPVIRKQVVLNGSRNKLNQIKDIYLQFIEF